MIIDCKYVGNFNITHNENKKRRMTNGAKKKAMSILLNEGKSANYFREEEAVRLMNLGKFI